MYQKWIERLQNILDIQKSLGHATIQVEFTRMDLIELRVMVQSLIDLDNMDLIELRVMVQSLIDLDNMDESEKSQNYCAACPIKDSMEIK